MGSKGPGIELNTAAAASTQSTDLPLTFYLIKRAEIYPNMDVSLLIYFTPNDYDINFTWFSICECAKAMPIN